MRLITILAAGLAAVVCADRSQFGTPMRPFADDMSYDAGLGSSSPNGPLHARGSCSTTGGSSFTCSDADACCPNQQAPGCCAGNATCVVVNGQSKCCPKNGGYETCGGTQCIWGVCCKEPGRACAGTSVCCAEQGCCDFTETCCGNTCCTQNHACCGNVCCDIGERCESAGNCVSKTTSVAPTVTVTAAKTGAGAPFPTLDWGVVGAVGAVGLLYM